MLTGYSVSHWVPTAELLSVPVSGLLIRGWVWKPDCNRRMRLSGAVACSKMMNGVTSWRADEQADGWCLGLGHTSTLLAPPNLFSGQTVSLIFARKMMAMISALWGGLGWPSDGHQASVSIWAALFQHRCKITLSKYSPPFWLELCLVLTNTYVSNCSHVCALMCVCVCVYVIRRRRLWHEASHLVSEIIRLLFS